MRIVLKALLAILVAAGLAVFAFNVAAEPVINIPADYALKGAQDSCTAESHQNGTFLTVVATEEDGIHAATLFTGNSLDIATTTSMQETMRLMDKHCPGLVKQYRIKPVKKVGYEKAQSSAN